MQTRRGQSAASKGRKPMSVSLARMTSLAPARLARGALLGLALAGAGAAFAPADAQAGHRERHWTQGSGLDHHYRPIRRNHHWRPHAPVYGYGYERPYVRHVHREVYRPPAYGYYAPAYFYGEHCVVKKKWRGFHRVRRVVCT
jgi:hypothetical protein